MHLSELSQDSRGILQALRGLPLRIEYDTNIIESYMTERQAVQTEKQLKAFTRQWNSIWKIPWCKYWAPTRQESQLVSGYYDPWLALRCIDKNGPTGTGCSHLRDRKSCISASIMAPSLLLKIMQICSTFEAPEGLVLLQILKSLRVDLRAQSSEDMFTYVNERRFDFWVYYNP